MKKKTLAVLLAAALGASMLWGCGKGNDAGASAPRLPQQRRALIPVLRPVLIAAFSFPT